MNWIKMRTNLRKDPHVRLIVSKLSESSGSRVSVFSVIGALYELWSLGDEFTTDGKLVGYTAADLDRDFNCPGFCAALAHPDVDWLEIGSTFVQIKRFQEHNGQSAKQRANAQRRMQRSRATPAQRRRNNPVAPAAQRERNTGRNGSATREEENREEENTESAAADSPAEGGEAPAAGPQIDSAASGAPGCTRTPSGTETRGNDVSASRERARDGSPTVMEFPCRGANGRTWCLSERKLAEYRESYPGMDVLAALRACRQWCIDNPGRSATWGGMPARCTRWLNNAANRGEFREDAHAPIARIGPGGAVPRRSNVDENRERAERVAARFAEGSA